MVFLLDNQWRPFTAVPLLCNSWRLSCIPAVLMVIPSSRGEWLGVSPTRSPSVPGCVEEAFWSSEWEHLCLPQVNKRIESITSSLVFSLLFLRGVSLPPPALTCLKARPVFVRRDCRKGKEAVLVPFFLCQTTQTSCDCTQSVCGCTLFSSTPSEGACERGLLDQRSTAGVNFMTLPYFPSSVDFAMVWWEKRADGGLCSSCWGVGTMLLLFLLWMLQPSKPFLAASSFYVLGCFFLIYLLY